MASTNNNPLLAGVRGRIGNLVIKQYKYGTVITQMPDFISTEPTEGQKRHRAHFAAAVKYAKEQKRNHINQYGFGAKPESQVIYLQSIRAFMAGIKRVMTNDVHFENSWEGWTDKQITADVIRIATEIVTGEYDKKWAVKEKEVVKKSAAKKKVALKKSGKRK